MNLKEPITLPILFNTKSTSILKDLGVESNDKPELRDVTFFTIDHVYPYFPDDDERAITAICSGGEEYLCDDTVERVILAIKKLMN